MGLDGPSQQARLTHPADDGPGPGPVTAPAIGRRRAVQHTLPRCLALHLKLFLHGGAAPCEDADGGYGA